MFQIVDFSSINDIKFTYVRLQFQNFFPGVIPPDPHDKGDGRGRERRGRKERGEGRGGMGEPPEYKSWLRPCPHDICLRRPT
jgi:hypothetical protein